MWPLALDDPFFNDLLWEKHQRHEFNLDKTYQNCLNEGASSLQEPADQFYGDRTATIIDPCGNTWFLATHLKAISNKEIQQKATEFENSKKYSNI